LVEGSDSPVADILKWLLARHFQNKVYASFPHWAGGVSFGNFLKARLSLAAEKAYIVILEITLHNHTQCLPNDRLPKGRRRLLSRQSLRPKAQHQTKDKLLEEPMQPSLSSPLPRPVLLEHQLLHLASHPLELLPRQTLPYNELAQPVALAVGLLQREGGLLSQSPNSLVVDRKNLARNLRKKRPSAGRRRARRRQRKINGTAEEMPRVGVVLSEGGSVVVTWVRASARSPMYLS
jgi:hypothetical protein